VGVLAVSGNREDLTPSDGFLTGRRIRARARLARGQHWFCGLPGFGKALRRDFAARGMDVEARFHQVLFEMR
jgi:hypothetical protein